MRPDHIATLIRKRRGQQFRPAEFLRAGWLERRDDEVAVLGAEEEAVAVLHNVGVRAFEFLALGNEREVFPNALTRGGFEAAELAVVAHAVDMAGFEEGRGHQRVQVHRVLLADLLCLPQHLRTGALRVELQHERAVVE